MIDNLASFADQVTVVAREVGVEGKLGGQAKVLEASGIWKNLTDNVNQLAENLTVQVRAINTVATAVAKGDLSSSVKVEAVGEVAVLKNNVNKMIVNLKETTRKNAEQDWLNTNLAKFNRMLQGQRDLREVSKLILAELAPMVKVQHGAFYIYETSSDNEEQLLKLYASYGFQERKHMANQFRPGEGLLGQCLLEKQRILLTNVPDDYVKINSALGEATPLNIVILPIIFEGNVLAIIELASFNFFDDLYLDFLDQLAESIGIVINTVHVNMRTEELLKQSQSLTEELQQQQEELTQTNEELEEKANLLVDQKAEVERKNHEVEESRHILEEKAEQLSITSKYKSEFLANMSHELRTPLNSLLVLAQQLKENIEGNLTEKQIEFANIIYDSGNDLLGLINEILDLSKIESGVVTPNYSDVFLSDIQESMEHTFQHMAQEKGLNFDILIGKGTPEFFNTDKKRILQILKNLISNAFKFTSKGSVTLKINPVLDGWIKGNDTLDNAENVLAFEVTDTGIGISEDKQKIVFEAFQQADGSTSRKYGGTGLGLSISREIAQILGGEIRLKSEVGKGSTFTLYLPLNSRKSYDMKTKNSVKDPGKVNKNSYKKSASINTSNASENNFKDDREDISPDDKTLLIIEDDIKFANILSTMARSKGFKVIVTLKGGNAVEYVHKYMPAAIILDLRLPDIDGWTILERIKSDIDIRHIPVHIISAEDERLRGLKKGALTYLHKPVNNEELNETFDNIKTHLNVSIQNLLVLSKKYKQWDTKKIFDDMNIKIIFKNSGNEAIELLKKQSIDCIILDSDLTDMSITEFVTTLQKNSAFSEIPVIVYSKGDIDKDEELVLNELAEKSILKEVKSSERLLDEVTLFLHKIIDSLPDSKKDIIKRIYQSDDVLKGKKILIVDDDMRNIFALTSVLERHDVVVLSEENGKNAINALKNNPDIEVVLMDIMMPEMDGYETIKVIRKMSKFKDLPIIALTAKAMKGDREKCINAGASDYITKPVDTAQLLSLLRVWLYK
jgi:signal transduction histidine kinase/DNA-binding response OmpR family regulator/HAMP domain-containing protein